MKHLVFTVTNDLLTDQRMIRICGSLVRAGFAVTLVGVRHSGAPPLPPQPFRQRRIYCFFRKGKGFYVEYNLRLFLYLLFAKARLLCAIDLDTILPCYFASLLKGTPRVYDAHELFCEMKEVVTRPRIHALWKRVERFAVPRFKHGYTVNEPIAREFERMYGVQYAVIRNVPSLEPLPIAAAKEKYILYQGAVNEGRSFETFIPAMKQVNAPLIICGEGNFMHQARELVRKYGLEQQISFKGRVPPAQLRSITANAWIGVTLFENTGKSNYLSLANRFFDYLHAGIPQLCVDYPAYREINNTHKIAVLIDNLAPETIAQGLNTLLNDQFLYDMLQKNCGPAREAFNWQQEEKKLVAFYSNIL